MVDRVEGHRRGVAPRLVLDDLCAQALGVHAELLDRPCPKGIGGREDGREPHLLKAVGELGDGRGLSRPVDAHEHDDDRLLVLLHVAVEVELALLEDRLYRALQRRLHDPVQGILAVNAPADQALPDTLLDLLDDRQSDVRFQEPDLEVPKELVDLALVDLAARVAHRGDGRRGLRLRR